MQKIPFCEVDTMMVLLVFLEGRTASWKKINRYFGC
jgi:hypothetical protein